MSRTIWECQSNTSPVDRRGCLSVVSRHSSPYLSCRASSEHLNVRPWHCWPLTCTRLSRRFVRGRHCKHGLPSSPPPPPPPQPPSERAIPCRHSTATSPPLDHHSVGLSLTPPSLPTAVRVGGVSLVGNVNTTDSPLLPPLDWPLDCRSLFLIRRTSLFPPPSRDSKRALTSKDN